MFAGRWVVCFASDGPTSRLNYLRLGTTYDNLRSFGVLRFF